MHPRLILAVTFIREIVLMDYTVQQITGKAGLKKITG